MVVAFGGLRYLGSVDEPSISPPRLSEQEWLQNRTIVLISVALVFGGFTMVISFLPLYLQDLGVQEVSLNATYSGVIISIAPLLAAVGGPLWGKLADRRGLKPIALRVMLAFGVGWVTFGTATQVWHLMLARVVVGLSGGYNALCVPLAIAGCPPAKLSRTIGAVQSTRTASIAFGPLIGGLLAGLVGIRITAYLASALFVLSFCLIHFFYREYPDRPSTSDILSRPLKIKELFRRKELAPLIILLFVTAFIDRGFSPIIPLLVLGFGTPAADTAWISGLVFSVAALFSTLAALLAGRVAGNYNPVWLLRFLVLGSAVFAAPLYWSSSVAVLGVYRSGLGFMAGGILTVAYVLGDRWIPPNSRAAGNAVLTSALLLGYALGPLSVGLLANLGLRVALGLCFPTFALLLFFLWRAVPVAEC